MAEPQRDVSSDHDGRQMPQTQNREIGAAASVPQSRADSVGTAAASLARQMLLWLGLLALALICRLLIYQRVEHVLHADEAVQGLMARHILGGAVQLYSYGNVYLGTLPAHWIALCFALFGTSVGVLKWAVGVESLALVVANFLLAREIAGGDRRAGFLAALLTAVGPLYLLEWSLRPRGGQLEVATLSALAFWAMLRAFRPATGSGEEATASLSVARRWLALAAFLLGLGWWTNPTMFYAMATCALVFLMAGGRLRRDARAWLLAGACFLVGSMPFWLYNVKYAGRTIVHLWQSIHAGPQPALLDRLVEAARVSLPIVLGTRQTESLESLGLLAFLVIAAIYLIALIAAVAAGGQPSEPQRSSTGGVLLVRCQGVWVLLMFSVIALAVFLLGPFSSQSRDPVVLLPLYAALPVLAGIGLARLWSRGGDARPIAVVGVAILAVIHLTAYRQAQREVVQPIFGTDRVPADLAPLKQILQENGIAHVFTNYYIGYRLAFETEEKVIACTDGVPIRERYEPFAQQVRETAGPVAYILDSRMAEWLRADALGRKIDFKEEELGGFRVFHALPVSYRPAFPPGPHLCVPGAIEVGDWPRQVGPGQRFSVSMTVKNKSFAEWPAYPHWRAVLVSYHLVDARSSAAIRFDNPRVPLGEQAVGPGQSATISLEVEAPSSPGRYAFVPDLLIEFVAWFSNLQPDLSGKAAWREFSVE